jgi:hypothetical protein
LHIIIIIICSQAGWYTSVMPAFRRLRQEDHKFEARLGYTQILSPKINK